MLCANALFGQWYLGPFGRKPEPLPPAVVDCVIQARDFKGNNGPRVEKKDWSDPCVLAKDVDAAQLANVKETADFLNARVAFYSQPTKAVFVSTSALVVYAPQPVNVAHLVSAERALDMWMRVVHVASRVDPGCRIPRMHIAKLENPFSRVEYNDETRRPFMVGKLSLGLVSRTYASDNSEAADVRVAAELKDVCVAPDFSSVFGGDPSFTFGGGLVTTELPGAIDWYKFPSVTYPNGAPDISFQGWCGDLK
jgi:hypothetical protein